MSLQSLDHCLCLAANTEEKRPRSLSFSQHLNMGEFAEEVNTRSIAMSGASQFIVNVDCWAVAPFEMLLWLV